MLAVNVSYAFLIMLFPEASSQRLADLLLEGQPAVRVSGLLLRQWYAMYHPASAPLRFDTADALEEGMGDELRAQYAGLKCWALATVLCQRRKAVEVSHQVCRSWLEKYAAVDEAPPGKRRRGVAEAPAASSAASSSGIATKLVGAQAVEEDRNSYIVLFEIIIFVSIARISIFTEA